MTKLDDLLARIKDIAEWLETCDSDEDAAFFRSIAALAVEARRDFMDPEYKPHEKWCDKFDALTADEPKETQ